MIIQIDPSSSEPLHTQIAAELRRAIDGGDLELGRRLPPARELAASLEVHMHTVRRAYAALREEGLLDVRRGRGVTVVDGGRDSSALRRHLAAFVTEARRLGLGRDAIVQRVEDQL